MNYSVLMSVYKNEKAEHLRIAMNSMWKQTVPTDDFVLICDGPLPPELNAVIDEMESEHPELHVIRFEKNGGLGHALQVGIKECENEIIARMDSDDISVPERCEKELAFLNNNPSISLVGGIIEEFTETEPNSNMPLALDGMRVVPEKQEDIIQFAKTRNPFNHPSVMFRKKDVLAAGNYPDVRFMQDYFLWIHMLFEGFKGYNIQETLVYMRADTNLFRRRSGKVYRKIQLDLFKQMKDHGFISNIEYIKSCSIRIGSSMAPNWLRRLLFKKILRQKTA